MQSPPPTCPPSAPPTKKFKKNSIQTSKEGIENELLKREINTASARIASIDRELQTYKETCSILTERIKFFEDQKNKELSDKYFSQIHPTRPAPTVVPSQQAPDSGRATHGAAASGPSCADNVSGVSSHPTCQSSPDLEIVWTSPSLPGTPPPSDNGHSEQAVQPRAADSPSQPSAPSAPSFHWSWPL